jgi:putative aminopeptidase
MNRNYRWIPSLLCALTLAAIAAAQTGQHVPGTLTEGMRALVETPAVPGYEQELAAKIAKQLQAYAPKTDGMSNVIVTLGSGAPHRLIVAPMDEPGYIVTSITADGYLQLQRLPQNISAPLFNELHSAQPVVVRMSQQKWISGAVAGLSLHLQPGRQHPPSPADLDEMFIDVGATNAADVRAAGVDVLSPLALERTFYEMANNRWTSPAIGDRFGAAALIELTRRLDPNKIHGTLTVAFVGQQWTGVRGLERLLQMQKPDEVIYVGRLMRPAAAAQGQAETPNPFANAPGSGVLIASTNPQDAPTGLAAELKKLAGENKIPITTDFSAPLVTRGNSAPAALPERSVHLAIATAWPSTPAEFIDGHDVMALAELLEAYLQGEVHKVELPVAAALPSPVLPARPSAAPATETILQQLVETYGVSGGHEGAVKDAIANLLPPWAKPETDAAGNLVLHWESNHSKKNPQRILVVAHQDEIGYEVHAILPDGRLDLEQKGGAVPGYFLGHPALVHSANGMHPGVMELPDGWQKSDFQWPRGARLHARMNIGAQSAEQALQMGIKAGDFVTVPKKYRKLLGTKASARSFDDRVGCAALVAAAWAIGPDPGANDITFVWSTSEELGLDGAAAIAKRLAAEGHAPDYVFAVDTFVSADSPLESKRFGNAPLGQGFVVRAVDNSNIVPHKLVEKVVSLARSQKIAVQYGATGGGNDGSVFTAYGGADVALGWPLRYSHSPDEVIDVRDLDALAKVIAAIGNSW